MSESYFISFEKESQKEPPPPTHTPHPTHTHTPVSPSDTRGVLNLNMQKCCCWGRALPRQLQQNTLIYRELNMPGQDPPPPQKKSSVILDWLHMLFWDGVGKERGHRHVVKSKICKLIIVVIMVTVITSVIDVQFTVYFKVHLKSFQSKVNMIVTVVSNTIKCFFFCFPGNSRPHARAPTWKAQKQHSPIHPLIHPLIPSHTNTSHGKSPASRPEVMKESAVTRTLAHIPHFVSYV